ncbi:MAG: TIGR00730 family Rossman fold protein [Acidobacteriota bacterium]
MSKINSLCVFCGSSKGKNSLYLEAAYETGKFLAEKNIEMVYGGGNVGLMGMAAKGVLDNGGKVTGIITDKLNGMEVGHTGLTEMKVTGSMHERKSLMNKLSDGFIVLPGGIGTIEETFEMFTWYQLGDHEKPIGILNVNEFYSGLINFLKHVVSEGFLRGEHLEYLIVESDPEKLIRKILNSNITHLEKWFDRDKNIIK